MKSVINQRLKRYWYQLKLECFVLELIQQLHQTARISQLKICNARSAFWDGAKQCANVNDRRPVPSLTLGTDRFTGRFDGLHEHLTHEFSYGLLPASFLSLLPSYLHSAEIMLVAVLPTLFCVSNTRQLGNIRIRARGRVMQPHVHIAKGRLPQENFFLPQKIKKLPFS